MSTVIAAHAGLFFSALIAATIFPAQSEAVLATLLLQGYKPWTLIAAATVGNVLGSVINWLLGRGIAGASSRWAPRQGLMLEHAQRWYQRYGRWSLLLSWMPIIGDPLTLVAGMLREPLPVFLLLVTIAKLGRYLVLAVLVLP